MEGPQPLCCHCFLQCMPSVKHNQVCCIAVTVHPETNVSAYSGHQCICSSVTSYFMILSSRQLDRGRLPESKSDHIRDGPGTLPNS